MPDDDIFSQLVSSMTTIINSQARASFSAATFLQQKRRETLVSLLPRATHASVNHALLSTPSSSSLFTEDVIRDSLTQLKDDSQLSLLKNLSSLKGGKQSASTASALGHPWSSSSSYSRSFLWSSCGSKRPSSPSPAHKLKVAFKGILRSPTSKKSFSK